LIPIKTEIRSNQNLLEYLREKGYELPSPCGGKGICGKCRVRILEGIKTLAMPYTGFHEITLDEWEKGWRLACKTRLDEEMVIEIDDLWNKEADILVSGNYDVNLQPYSRKIFLDLNKPSISDQRSDGERILSELGDAEYLDLELVKTLPEILRDRDYRVTVILFGKTITGIESGNTTDKHYGAAVDIGTTTIAGSLINLNNGDEIGTFSMLNPQKNFGDDVITRINYTIEVENGLKKMQGLLIDALNQMFKYFEEKYQIPSHHIYHVNVAGNTVMLHLLAGLPVKNIAVSPFLPVINQMPNIRGKDLGLKINPNAFITAAPMISGYIGADTVSCILAVDMLKNDGYSLLVDIGTNGEIVLGNKNGLIACAAAAGPALEGAHIKCGTGGIKGAINKVKIGKDGVNYTTIGNQPAIGICGSGIVDAIAQMLQSGMIEPSGRMLTASEAELHVPGTLASKVGEYKKSPCIVIAKQEDGAVNDIFITQKDVREIQLAKAAIAAGIHILMKEMNIDFEDIERVYLAGGFGNYIDKDHAAEIGLIPNALRGKVIQVGNAALTGGKMLLKSGRYLEEAIQIWNTTKFIELSTRLDFNEIFVEQMEFQRL